MGVVRHVRAPCSARAGPRTCRRRTRASRRRRVRRLCRRRCRAMAASGRLLGPSACGCQSGRRGRSAQSRRGATVATVRGRTPAPAAPSTTGRACRHASGRPRPVGIRRTPEQATSCRADGGGAAGHGCRHDSRCGGSGQRVRVDIPASRGPSHAVVWRRHGAGGRDSGDPRASADDQCDPGRLVRCGLRGGGCRDPGRALRSRSALVSGGCGRPGSRPFALGGVAMAGHLVASRRLGGAPRGRAAVRRGRVRRLGAGEPVAGGRPARVLAECRLSAAG